MLVLSRLNGEAIIIGDDIKIQVLEVSGGKVRLGITAPGDVDVHREEVWHRINGETKPATQIRETDND